MENWFGLPGATDIKYLLDTVNGQLQVYSSDNPQMKSVFNTMGRELGRKYPGREAPQNTFNIYQGPGQDQEYNESSNVCCKGKRGRSFRICHLILKPGQYQIGDFVFSYDTMFNVEKFDNASGWDVNVQDFQSLSKVMNCVLARTL